MNDRKRPPRCPISMDNVKAIKKLGGNANE